MSTDRGKCVEGEGTCSPVPASSIQVIEVPVPRNFHGDLDALARLAIGTWWQGLEEIESPSGRTRLTYSLELQVVGEEDWRMIGSVHEDFSDYIRDEKRGRRMAATHSLAWEVASQFPRIFFKDVRENLERGLSEMGEIS